MTKARTWINIGLALMLVCLCILSLPAPGMAHIVSGVSFSAPLPVAETPNEVRSELLTKEGQEIYIDLLEGNRNIEIPLYIPEGVYWCVITTCDEENLFVNSYGGGSSITHLTLAGWESVPFYRDSGYQNALVSLTNDLQMNPVIETTEVTEETETTIEVTAMTEVTEGTEGSEGTEGTEPPAEPVVEAVTATVNVSVYYLRMPEEETPAVQISGVEPAVEESAAEETVDETTEEETSGTVSIESISATIHVTLCESSGAAVPQGRLAQVPAQYHPAVMIPVVNGTAESELTNNGAEFPAMTRYTMDGKTHILYDGGTITIPAEKKIYLDLSKAEEPTDEEVTEDPAVEEEAAEETTETETEPPVAEEEDQTLVLIAGDHENRIVYAEAPTFDKAQTPVIVQGMSFALPGAYLWSGIAPTVSVEQLCVEGRELVWTAMDAARWNITASETQLSLTAVGAPLRAGTYRLILTWTENETTLYSLQTEFYVRSENL